MNTKLCIFDLDGTLINSLYDLADAMNYALQKYGFPVHDREKYRFMVGSGISVLADRAMAVPAEIEKKEAVLANFNDYYQVHNTDNTVPYEGITELLDNLDNKGVLYSVLSNKPDKFTKQIINKLFPDRKFAAVIGKRDEFPRKPDPASVNNLISDLGFNSRDCLYIGDSNIDMHTAKNASLRSVGVSWGFRPISELLESGAQHIAEKPADILNYL